MALKRPWPVKNCLKPNSFPVAGWTLLVFVSFLCRFAAADYVFEFASERNTVEIPHGEDLDPGYDNWTCEFWLKRLSRVRHRWVPFIQKDGEEGGVRITSVFTARCSEGGRAQVDYLQGIPGNEWVHVALQIDRDAARIRAFINGDLFEERGAGALTGRVAARTALEIGGQNKHDFMLRDLRIWRGELPSEEDIKSSMHEKLSGGQKGLVGCWPIDEGQGDAVKDLCGFNHGRIAGEQLWRIHEPFLKDLDDAPRDVQVLEKIEFGPVELRHPAGEVTHQWYHNQNPIEGATSSTFTITDPGPEHRGYYYVAVDDERDELTPVESKTVRVTDHGSDWPMWRFDASRSARTSYDLPENLNLHWKRELPEPRRAWPPQEDDFNKLDFDASYAPVVKNNRVFVPSNATDSLTAYCLDDGRKLWRFYSDGPDTVGSDYMRLPHGGAYGYGGLSPQGYLAAGEDRLVVSGGRGAAATLDPEDGEVIWFNPGEDGHKSGGGYAVHADGGLDKFESNFRTNQMIQSRAADLSDQLDSEVFYKLAAGNRLIITTVNGTIYCFGPEDLETTHYAYEPSDLKRGSDRWAAVAADLLDELGEPGGYALMLGAGSGGLLRELLPGSDLHVVVAEGDPEKVRALRDELSEAGLYGRRAAVIKADPGDFSVQPYLFSLVVSEDLSETGAGPDDLKQVLDRLRPYGGVAWLGTPDDFHADGVSGSGADQVSAQWREDHLFAVRGGPLTGAGRWTHQYGDAGQSNFSSDELVQAPLGVLWFGGPCNANILPRHGHGPVPQVSGGRVVLPGPDTISARCVYTGREIWEQTFPGIGDPFHQRWPYPIGANQIGSPFVSLEDGIYVRYKTRLYVLEPDSGEIKETFQLPVEPELEGRPDWGHISAADDLIVTTVEPQVFDEDHYSDAFETMEDLWRSNWDGTSSRRLVVMDRGSGSVIRELEAGTGFRHNAIVAGEGTLFLIDGLSPGAAERLQRRGQPVGESVVLALDLYTGEEIWSKKSPVAGTWLSYSQQQDILIEGGRRGGLRQLEDEPGERIAAYSGATGEVLWKKDADIYWGPLSSGGDRLYIPRAGREESGASRALDLATGELIMRIQPQTGHVSQWTYDRGHGCGSHIASEHLLTFRSGAAAYYDLKYDSGTGYLDSMRAGCTNNLIPADGVLSAPDYTRTCVCSYPLQTSMAMIHMPDAPEVGFWTRYSGARPDPQGYGINYGAPGRRVDAEGRIWHNESGDYRRSPSFVSDSGESPPWVASSARRVEERILIEDLPDDVYTVGFHFAEPLEDVREGERVFDVSLNGKEMLSRLDIVKKAGGAMRAVVLEFEVNVKGGHLLIELDNAQNSILDPVISGLHLTAH